MNKISNKIRNYFCYCGIEKDEYNSLKKEAYVTNFIIWRVFHVLMVIAFLILYGVSFLYDGMYGNRIYYLIAFIYSVISTLLFYFVFKKDSIIAQLYIYLSIIVLLFLGLFVSLQRPDYPTVTFFIFLLITPLFMIDKPYFMSIVIVIASTVFLFVMHDIKSYDVWQIDFTHTILFSIVGIFLHIATNSIRIKEFVLNKKLNEQKDLDFATGLKNKGALVKNINAFLATDANKGILFIMDIDGFKSINDTYGHDVGDEVIRQVGEYLGNKFSKEKIVGRFGGDEFIIFIENDDDIALASRLAKEISSDVERYIKTPNLNQKLHVTIGIAIYRGEEKTYYEIFKKADIALYNAKNDGKNDFQIY